MINDPYDHNKTPKTSKTNRPTIVGRTRAIMENPVNHNVISRLPPEYLSSAWKQTIGTTSSNAELNRIQCQYEFRWWGQQKRHDANLPSEIWPRAEDPDVDCLINAIPFPGQVITDALRCALTTLAERVKLQVLRSLVSLSPTETIESAKMPTVAQMEETIKGQPPKDSNSEGQTNIRQL